MKRTIDENATACEFVIDGNGRHVLDQEELDLINLLT